MKQLWLVGILMFVLTLPVYAEDAPALGTNYGKVTNNSDIPVNVKVTKSDGTTQDVFVPKGSTVDLPPGTSTIKADHPTNDQLKQLPKDEASHIRGSLLANINVIVTQPDGSTGKVEDFFMNPATQVKSPVQTVTADTNATNTYTPPPPPEPKPEPVYVPPKTTQWTPKQNPDGTYEPEKQWPTESEHDSAYDSAYGDAWRDFSKGKITKEEYEKKIEDLQKKQKEDKKVGMNFEGSDGVGFAGGGKPKARDMDLDHLREPHGPHTHEKD